MDELNSSNAIQFTFIADGNEKKLDNNYSVTIYRIINELISNIIKHSQAQKALIQILINETEAQMIAEDNGIGILTEKLGVGIGMKNIQSRVSFLKGILNIDSSKKGTAIVITIPLSEL
jgi:signal transduction histidine kinase